MPTYQKKIFDSFKSLIEDNKENELDKKVLNDILNRVIDLAVKEDRGENIDPNIKAQTNNIVDLFS
ncbi:MAG: hypothetical protein WDZ45_07750 [Flavobacteriaceae bacterium]